MSAVLRLAGKDLRLLGRDKLALFWIFAFPLMFALFFGAIFSGEGEGGHRGALTLVVVDEDGSGASARLVERLEAHESVELAPPEGEDGDGRVALDAAREAVRKGRRAAYVRIPAGYGENPYALFGAGAGDGGLPAIEIGIDPRRRAEAGFLQGVLMEAMFASLRDRFTDTGRLRADLARAREEIGRDTGLAASQKLALQTFLGAVETFATRFDLEGLDAAMADGPGAGPVTVVDVSREQGHRPRSSYEVTFPQALVWGLMGVAMTFAITLVRERSSGALLRLRLAPIGRAQILAGKALACFLGCLATMVALLLFGAVALGVRCDSLVLLVPAMAATAIAFTGLMMTASVLGRTEEAVAGTSWGLMMPFAMIGGGMIPLIAMPSWLVTASVVSPFRWAITAIEGAVWRGYDAADMVLPCGVLVAFGAGFFALGVAVFARVDR